MTRWEGLSGAPRGADYAAHWDTLAATGAEIHGEANCVAALAPPGSRVLDAGCGTGRVAIRLAELGYACVGVDSDAAMLEHAARVAPGLTWVLADLASPALPAGPFDVIVAAGNVMPLLAPGTEAGIIAALARRTRVLIAGFGLAAEQLPMAEAPFDLAQYDAWCTAAGLELAARWSTWDRDPFGAADRYAVSVHVTPGGGTGLPVDGEPLRS